jgi:hypothetical protein
MMGRKSRGKNDVLAVGRSVCGYCEVVFYGNNRNRQGFIQRIFHAWRCEPQESLVVIASTILSLLKVLLCLLSILVTL